MCWRFVELEAGRGRAGSGSLWTWYFSSTLFLWLFLGLAWMQQDCLLPMVRSVDSDSQKSYQQWGTARKVSVLSPKTGWVLSAVTGWSSVPTVSQPRGGGPGAFCRVYRYGQRPVGIWLQLYHSGYIVAVHFVLLKMSEQLSHRHGDFCFVFVILVFQNKTWFVKTLTWEVGPNPIWPSPQM